MNHSAVAPMSHDLNTIIVNLSARLIRQEEITGNLLNVLHNQEEQLRVLSQNTAMIVETLNRERTAAAMEGVGDYDWSKATPEQEEEQRMNYEDSCHHKDNCAGDSDGM